MTDCKTMLPVTAAVALTPLAITELAITSGAGMGNSPISGIVNVAIPSSVDKISVVFGKLFGIGGGDIGDTSSSEDDDSSETEDS